MPRPFALRIPCAPSLPGCCCCCFGTDNGFTCMAVPYHWYVPPHAWRYHTIDMPLHVRHGTYLNSSEALQQRQLLQALWHNWPGRRRQTQGRKLLAAALLHQLSLCAHAWQGSRFSTRHCIAGSTRAVGLNAGLCRRALSTSVMRLVLSNDCFLD